MSSSSSLSVLPAPVGEGDVGGDGVTTVSDWEIARTTGVVATVRATPPAEKNIVASSGEVICASRVAAFDDASASEAAATVTTTWTDAASAEADTWDSCTSRRVAMVRAI